MDNKNLKYYFNIWIELINLMLFAIVLSFSLYNAYLLRSESVMAQPGSANTMIGITLVHIFWLLIYFQIPVFYYLVTARKKINESTFRFKIIKIHWLRTCLSVLFAFIALYNLQIMTGLSLNLSIANFIIIFVILSIISVAGNYYFNRSFYNRKITVEHRDQTNLSGRRMIIIFVITFIVFLTVIILKRFFL